jgi:hypothetical protein
VVALLALTLIQATVARVAIQFSVALLRQVAAAVLGNRVQAPTLSGTVARAAAVTIHRLLEQELRDKAIMAAQAAVQA